MLAEDISAALSKIPKIREDLQWSFYDGHYPRHHGSGGKMVVVDPASDPCVVPGAKYDIGTGSYQSRTAYRRATALVRSADVLCAYALRALRCPQAGLPALTDYRLGQALAGCDSLARRLSQLAELPSVPTSLASHVSRACEHTNDAYALLIDAFQAWRLEQSQLNMCFVCLIRPLEKRRAVQGRCPTCYMYHRRHGTERPRSLDKDKGSVADAVETAMRHRAAGHGFGYD